MSRVTVWALCSLSILLAGLAKGNTDLNANIAMLTLIAIPLLLHWFFEAQKERNQ